MSEDPRPCVTLIMPVRDEEYSIENCLDAIQGQTFHDMEILIIDGMSTDNTVAIIEERMVTDPRIRIVKNEQRVIPIALNLGLAEANGTFLVRVDGHSVVTPNYVERIVEH